MSHDISSCRGGGGVVLGGDACVALGRRIMTPGRVGAGVVWCWEGTLASPWRHSAIRAAYRKGIEVLGGDACVALAAPLRYCRMG